MSTSPRASTASSAEPGSSRLHPGPASAVTAGVAASPSRDNERLRGILESLGAADAKIHVAGDLDRLDEAVREAGVRCVVFERASDLLRGIWDEQIDFADWQARGVELHFVEPFGTTPGETMACVQEAWSGWLRGQQRRRRVAGAILSAIVLGAVFAMSLFVPRRDGAPAGPARTSPSEPSATQPLRE